MEPVYRPVIGLAVTLFKAMDWRVHVSGAENIPRRGPAVLASNHVGYLDFVVVGYGALDADRLVRFAAKKEVFDHPVSGPLMRGMKHIPVDRDGDRMAVMDEAKRRLARGQIIGMFPEGTISRSFMPAQGKTGTARMAIEAGVPLIPTAVWGCQRISTKAVKRNLQRHLEIRVTYGQAVPYGPEEDPRDVTRRLTDAITGLVTGLQDTYTQVPADDDDRWWLPAHLGGTAPTPDEADEMARQERIARRKRRQDARQAEGSDPPGPAGPTA